MKAGLPNPLAEDPKPNHPGDGGCLSLIMGLGSLVVLAVVCLNYWL